MTKYVLSLMFGLLLLSTPMTFAKESIGDVANFNTKYDHEYTEDYDVDEKSEDNSFYISDEQVQDMNAPVDVEEENAIDEKTTFDQKVINSGHFSSTTATKTWIPLNRVK